MDMDNLRKTFPPLKTESLLKISKAISKAGERDFYNFDIKCPDVLSEYDLQHIEELFGKSLVKMENVDESILSAFGDGFEKELNSAKSDTKGSRLKELKKSYGLSDDELLVYASFLRSMGKKEYLSKILIPLITRTPVDFLKCKDYIIRLLSALRKLPLIEKGTYIFPTKQKFDFFKTGKIYDFPSFILGNKASDEDDDDDTSSSSLSLDLDSDSSFSFSDFSDFDFSEEEEEEEEEDSDDDDSDDEVENNKIEVFLKIRGKTKKGHVFEGYGNNDGDKKFVIFEPETSFKVKRIERKDTYYTVYGKFVKKKKLILKDAVKGYAETASNEKTGQSTEQLASHSGPKYTERFPASLSDILKPESGYKAMTLKDAIEKAGIEGIDVVIKKAFAKKKERESILKDFNLTKEDVMSIFIYTLQNEKYSEKSVYRVLNNALANRTKESLLPLREYIFYLLMGLRDLPRFIAKSNLFRGVRMSRKELDATYYEGRTLMWTTFTSTTTNEKTARYFASQVKNKEKHDPDECSVLFEIHGKFRGYSIGTFSNFENEEEVLLEPDTKFTVAMVSKEEGTGITRVVLVVKETEPMLKSEMDTFKEAYEEVEWKEDEMSDIGAWERRLGIKTVPSDPRGSFSQGGIGQELSFSSSSPMNIGNIGPTGNPQGRSSISTSEASRGNLKACEGGHEHKQPVHNLPMKGAVPLPIRGTPPSQSHSPPPHADNPTPMRGAPPSVGTKRTLPLPTRGSSPSPYHPHSPPPADKQVPLNEGSLSVNSKRGVPLPMRGAVPLPIKGGSPSVNNKRTLPSPARGSSPSLSHPHSPPPADKQVPLNEGSPSVNSKRGVPLPMRGAVPLPIRGGSPSVNGERGVPLPMRGAVPLPIRGGLPQKRQLPVPASTHHDPPSPSAFPSGGFNLPFNIDEKR